MGEVGLEPTKAKPADLQSAPFAARDTPPDPSARAADEKAPASRGQVEGALSCAAPRPVNLKSVFAAAIGSAIRRVGE